MTMGTAATMTGITDAIGMTLPGASSILAADSGHIRMATQCGKRAVEMVWEDLTPTRIMTRQAFLNGIVVAMAMGCSTNAVIHLVAMARRAGHDIGLDDFDAASRKVPVIANIRPSGDKYLMEDFAYAGGMLGLLSRLKDHLDLSQINVSGKTWAESLEGAKVYNDDVIRTPANAIYKEGALAVLRGNIAPNGCVIKPSAAGEKFQKHSGPALVYDSYEDMKKNIDRDDLDVTEETVLILRNAGPLGGPGMPEWGMLPIPKVLVKKGVRDMVRISDARMSGTSYGACILHVSPESYIGGPLALVKTGDIIDLDNRVTTVEGDVENLTITVNEFDNRVTNLENGGAGPFQITQDEPYTPPAPTGANAAAGGNGAVASGDNSTAVGNQSVASGDNSTALGQGATASHDNSVALGQGSATTVGAQTNYNAAYVGGSTSTGEVNVGGRTISGVAPGIAGTDAVNVNQLQAGVNHAINVANQYTDNRITQIQNDVWTMDRGYRGATASAMAMAGLPQAYLPGKSMLAVGFGGYQNEYGMAVGLSGITENGRYVYKVQASGNTTRDWGFSVGAGLQW